MAQLMGGPTTNTTQAEQTVMEFLYSQKGVEFTAGDIERETGIRADLVDPIMDNLRYKGFEVATERHRGVHYFITNSWWSYIVGAGLIVFMIIMLMGAWMDYLDTCPGCPDHIQEQPGMRDVKLEK